MPVGLLRHKFEDRDEPAAIDSCVTEFQNITWLKQLQTKIEGIATGRMRHFVNE